MPTRSMFLSESQVSSWQGTGVYTYNSAAKTSSLMSGYSPDAAAMTLYEVSVMGQSGSWWLFTSVSSAVPQSWWDNGGAENLQASASIQTSINGQPVLRPALLIWWIPAQTLAGQAVAPTILSGDIIGLFPLIQPSTVPPDPSFSVVATANSLTVTLPPQTTPTTILITT